MNTIENKIQEAIKQSISQDEVVHLAFNQELHDELVQICEDWTDYIEGKNEYWGEDWVIHMDKK